MATFKYDLAFSFLAGDEQLALALNDLLQDRLSTFIYSERQEEVAGIDGETTFNHVFGAEARVVAILYRDGWGDTPWTRIEQTAIRNRAFNEGYDFTAFLLLDTEATLPPWVPKTQIWVGLDRWGTQGAASVLESRVQQAGGRPRAESALEKAARVKRARDFAQQRSTFLSSQSGVDAASRSVTALFDEIERLVGKIEGFSIRTERDDSRFTLYCSGFTVTLGWQLQWANSLDQSALYLMVWNGPVSLRGHAGRHTKLDDLEYNFELLNTGQTGWVRANDSRSFLDAKQLADYAVTRLLERLSA